MKKRNRIAKMLVCVFAVGLLSLCACSSGVPQEEVDKLNSEIEELRAENDSTREEKESIQKEKESLQAEKDSLQEENESLQDALATAQAPTEPVAGTMTLSEFTSKLDTAWAENSNEAGISFSAQCDEDSISILTTLPGIDDMVASVLTHPEQYATEWTQSIVNNALTTELYETVRGHADNYGLSDITIYQKIVSDTDSSVAYAISVNGKIIFDVADVCLILGGN